MTGGLDMTDASLQISKKNSQQKWKKIIRNWQLYVFLLPAVVYFIIFNYAPMYGVLIAFKKYNPGAGIWGSPWADPWYKNFMDFFRSAWATTTIRNTLILAIYSFIVGTFLPVVLALMINEVRSVAFKKSCRMLPISLISCLLSCWSAWSTSFSAAAASSTRSLSCSADKASSSL